MYSPQPDPKTLAPPPIRAFERLWVTDGLRMTAERWRGAHQYHQQRQNFHYQSLHQTGIVSGLGVVPVAAPGRVNPEYRDGRWVQVQPGIAIDAQGNPIVVTHPQTFRIQSKPPTGERWRVYLVAQYVDPDGLQHPADQEQVREQFRIVEKTHLDGLDIELCRIQLEPGEVTIQVAENVYEPGINTLDFRYRAFVQVRPWGMVQMGQIRSGTPGDEAIAQHLTQLMEATDALFPSLRGNPQVTGIPLDAIAPAPAPDVDMLYLPYHTLQDLTSAHTKSFKAFLQGGSTLMVVAGTEAARLGQLKQIKQELTDALAQLDPALDPQDFQNVQSEIAAYAAEIKQVIQDFGTAIARFAKAMDYPISGGRLDPTHPIRRYPFLFSALPEVDGQSITLFNWGGIVMIVGDLPSAWGLDEQSTQSRESIRSAQELGINLLHFAWRRRHMMRLQSTPS